MQRVFSETGSFWDACTPTDLSAVDEPTCGRDASIACTPADLCAVDEPTCGRVARIGDAATLSGAAASGQRSAVTYVELDGRGCGRTLDEGAARHQRECMRVACHAGPFNAAGLCKCLCARSPYSARQAASYLELDGSVCGRTLDEGAASLACAALTSAGHQQFFGGYMACSKLLGICEIPLQLQGL